MELAHFRQGQDSIDMVQGLSLQTLKTLMSSIVCGSHPIIVQIFPSSIITGFCAIVISDGVFGDAGPVVVCVRCGSKAGGSSSYKSTET